MAIDPNLVGVPAQSKKLRHRYHDNNGWLSTSTSYQPCRPRNSNKLCACIRCSLNVSVQNATLAVTQSGTFNITNISGTVSLPTGASTATLQTTGNTSLNSIDTKTPALSGGRCTC